MSRVYYHVQQEYVNDCAAACIMTLLDMNKVLYEEEVIRNKLLLNKDGAGIHELFNLLKEFGFNPELYEITDDLRMEITIDEIPTPCILYNRKRFHFTLLQEGTEDSIVYSDPVLDDVLMDKKISEILKDVVYLISVYKEGSD